MCLNFWFLSYTRPVIISLKGLQAQVQRFFYLSALEDCRHSGAHPFSQLQDSSILLRPFNFLLLSSLVVRAVAPRDTKTREITLDGKHIAV